MPQEAFRHSQIVEEQKKRLCKQIDRVIKTVEYGNYEWAIWQLEWLKRLIDKQILDPYKATFIGKVDQIINARARGVAGTSRVISPLVTGSSPDCLLECR